MRIASQVLCMPIVYYHFVFFYQLQNAGPRKIFNELMRRMQPWIDAWGQALQDRVDEQAPYDSGSYHAYLQWYTPRSRTRLVRIIQQQAEGPLLPPQSLLYPGHVGQALHQAVRTSLLISFQVYVQVLRMCYHTELLLYNLYRLT